MSTASARPIRRRRRSSATAWNPTARCSSSGSAANWKRITSRRALTYSMPTSASARTTACGPCPRHPSTRISSGHIHRSPGASILSASAESGGASPSSPASSSKPGAGLTTFLQSLVDGERNMIYRKKNLYKRVYPSTR